MNNRFRSFLLLFLPLLCKPRTESRLIPILRALPLLLLHSPFRIKMAVSEASHLLLPQFTSHTITSQKEKTIQTGRIKYRASQSRRRYRKKMKMQQQDSKWGEESEFVQNKFGVINTYLKKNLKIYIHSQKLFLFFLFLFYSSFQFNPSLSTHHQVSSSTNEGPRKGLWAMCCGSSFQLLFRP